MTILDMRRMTLYYDCVYIMYYTIDSITCFHVYVSQREKEKVEAMEQEVEGARRDFVVRELAYSGEIGRALILTSQSRYTTYW